MSRSVLFKLSVDLLISRCVVAESVLLECFHRDAAVRMQTLEARSALGRQRFPAEGPLLLAEAEVGDVLQCPFNVRLAANSHLEGSQILISNSISSPKLFFFSSC